MRAEHKYLVPIAVLPKLRAAIAPFMVLDKHGRGYEEKGYTVRSIYLDTPSLKYYHEKKAGIKVRRKLRVRAYNESTPDSWIFLEIKRKVQSKVSKNRAPTSFENLEPLFTSGDVDRYVHNHAHYPDALDDARRFLYHVYRYGLRPTHITVYEREAFLGRFDGTLRITFDRNLRGGYYLPLDDLYTERGLRYALPGYFILEVKYNTRFPAWLRPVLARYSLRARAISKYCLCAELYEKQRDSKVTVLANMPGSASSTIVSTAPTPRLAEDVPFLIPGES